MASSPASTEVRSDLGSADVTFAMPTDLLREADGAAAKQGWSRDQVLRQAVEYYLSTLRWQEIHRVFAPAFEAAGLRTEDDVEDYLDSLPEPVQQC